MATQITYPITMSIETKPTIVNLSIEATTQGPNAKEAISKLIESRKTIKEFILEKKSYKKDSYAQTNIRIIKKFKNEKVDGNIIKVFDCYEAKLYISAQLNNNDTVISDFVDIFNLAISLDFYFSYQHDVLPSEKENIDQKLYSKCINKGLENIRDIVAETELKNKIISLSEIIDGSASSTLYFESKCSSVNYNVEEQIVVPELIEDLFNNNIVFSKTLHLRVSLV